MTYWNLNDPPTLPPHNYMRGSRLMVVAFIRRKRRPVRPAEILPVFNMNKNGLAKLLRDALDRGELAKKGRGLWVARKRRRR